MLYLNEFSTAIMKLKMQGPSNLKQHIPDALVCFGQQLGLAGSQLASQRVNPMWSHWLRGCILTTVQSTLVIKHSSCGRYSGARYSCKRHVAAYFMHAGHSVEVKNVHCFTRWHNMQGNCCTWISPTLFWKKYVVQNGWLDFFFETQWTVPSDCRQILLH